MKEYKRVSILGIIFFPCLIALMHSINKRVLANEIPITGGKVWLWWFGWSLFGATFIGPWIYCAVKYSEMNEVREQIAQRIV